LDVRIEPGANPLDRAFEGWANQVSSTKYPKDRGDLLNLLLHRSGNLLPDAVSETQSAVEPVPVLKRTATQRCRPEATPILLLSVKPLMPAENKNPADRYRARGLIHLGTSWKA